MRRVLLICIILGISGQLNEPAAAKHLQAGIKAHKQGDYATAVKEFRPLAEQGDPIAQTRLGLLYYNGDGVPQDYQEARRWWRLAAEQGHAYAQFNLGTLYKHGLGVPQDYVQALKWYTLTAGGNKCDKGFCDRLASKMTPGQIAEARRLAREWKAKRKH